MNSKTLYEPSFEHDACGIGAVANIDGNASHKIVDKALSIVEKLEHRAGKDASGETGDGVGILLQICHDFFKKACERGEIASRNGSVCKSIGDQRDYGVGMFFFSMEEAALESEKIRFEKCCAGEGLEFLGWRKVPVNENVLGKKALDCMPQIWQSFVARPENCEKGLDFDRKLYVLRREFEKDAGVLGVGSDPKGAKLAKQVLSESPLGEGVAENREAACSEGETSPAKTYICSLSSRTIVYKGMFLVNELRTFYKDLQSEEYKSALAIVHSRFSTNTQASWQRAHPNRFIAHNGEINTIRGNVDRMLAREETLRSLQFSDCDMKKILPAVDTSGSDSAMLDNTLEFLVMNGMPLPLAVMTCIPEPWKHDENMSREKKDFYHYWATMMESWDGPAAILFSDGDLLGATLDRNGLRPSRYYITKDGLLILSSEVGVLDIPEENIAKKSRLMPGKMLLLDTVQKKIISDEDCKKNYAALYPYGEWLDMNLLHLADLKIPNKKIPVSTMEERTRLYRAFGWKSEDINEMILPLAKNGLEPTASMGVDIPLAVMSEKHPSLFSYFKQLFAQVTNPPIDSLREKIVTDTTVYVGKDGNLLEPVASNCRVLEINNPILTGVDLIKIAALNQPGLKAKRISILFEKGLESALENLFSQIDSAYAEGCNIIILSDRGVDENHGAIPAILAVSAVEQYLIRTKKRTALSVILESGEVRDVHQAAMCLGYGARAVNPYLAHEAIAELIDQKILDKDYHTAIDDYNKGIINGIVKIAAKMGISTIQSYQSAQIFEAVGIADDVIEKYFTNTVSRVGGIGLKEIEEDVLYHHRRAFSSKEEAKSPRLDFGGIHKLKVGPEAEDHLLTRETILALQESTKNGDYARFKEYTALVDSNDHPHTLRAMLDFDFDKNGGISLEEVESVEKIVQRFKTGAMSYGSISEEAHKCLALAMNHLHGKSNSGEGGENPERLGTEYNSAIKQVASGRFGVTEEYLLSAKEIQIKMAQGAKPGEGGHLPGKKVYPWIARTRYATPGVALISPPPHHDIYSIEDLAQLIYDLKNANRKARISVKLVSEAGVGTVASGVAKAGAQVILISGHDGGTGAAPMSSIHHAGLPWELGLSEAHQTLIQNGLRGRVVLETDGKLMSGRDVVIAALLGAEEFGFATAPLIALGCSMLRVCQLDTCPFGVATQNEKNRAKFPGKAEYVENFMKFVAQEMREIMARLGVRTVEELCGRSDLLKLKERQGFRRADLVDLQRLLAKNEDSPSFHGLTGESPDSWKQNRDSFDFGLEKTVDEKTLLPLFETGDFKVVSDGVAGKTCEAGFERVSAKAVPEPQSPLGEGVADKTTKRSESALRAGAIRGATWLGSEGDASPIPIQSTDRTVGTILGSEIQKRYGGSLSDDTFTVNFAGGAGQSFGAFIPKGLTLRLTGDANDAFGKGLSGGKLVLKKPAGFDGVAEDNIIVGNVALFGATSGKAFINGVAGERFCVRNSGASVVAEGCGDHGLEYMTGGTAVILGSTGKNLCAGMSGGVAYILDEKHDLYKGLNHELVKMYALDDATTTLRDKTDEENLRNLIEEHVAETGSQRGKEILSDWEHYKTCFKKIIPNDYLRIMTEIFAEEDAGTAHDEAVLASFRKCTA
ncbi:glutamate synthase large subunit [Treponema sp. UBA3813]|uniref:glutamate synthase large subunit n=1 Tax=Treponema sp. UBA3813 TaxID=1947715 RepID=UPI0025F8365C|nr:glutamate synthase large subunit [Treponema sp. UBA3813]